MNTITEFLHFILHLEEHLRSFTIEYGYWIYALLFAIIFLETGLVLFPFLPGDSLLFAVGALAAADILNLSSLLILLSIAAILGRSVFNYLLGYWIGPKVFYRSTGFWFRKDNLVKAHAFYEKYGSKAIILARFVPIIRTFVPFAAGIGEMNYRHFLLYNIVGGILWINAFVLTGYLLGNIPFVKQNFKLMILLIIFVSFLPLVYEWWKHRGEKVSLRK